jgi:quercetin dioxygenase-like cupin family protein
MAITMAALRIELRSMETWDITGLDVLHRQPQVLDSEQEGRAIVIQLPAGERMQEHQVHERAWLIVVSGAIEIDQGGDSVSGGAGFLAIFDPNERREVSATEDARLLLLLGPWPGEGHPSSR